MVRARARHGARRQAILLDCLPDKAYRKRQAEAVRLHGAGRSIDDIARELESDPQTVQGWIERKGGAS